MAIPVLRLMDTNLAAAQATVLSASSQENAFPASRLKDQSLGATWRSLLGWTIVSGFNAKIDFNRGGVKVATIAAGNYPTAAALCTAIVAALEAADAGQGWACTYSPSTFKFTISATPSFTLLWASGANATIDCGLDLGFSDSDTASATSHTGFLASYQSRHYILWDLGSALEVKALVARHFNILGGADLTFYSGATNTPWNGGGANPLTRDASYPGIAVRFFGAITQRYWAVVIWDVQNPAGFVELGEAYIGTYRQPSFPNSVNFDEDQDDRSSIEIALSGANYQTRRQRQRGWSIEWLEMPEGPSNAVGDDVLEAWSAVTPKGTNFFLAWDAVEHEANTVYCFRDSSVRRTYVPGGYWTYQTHLTEAVP